MRVHDPFKWKANEILKKKYEEPLKMLAYHKGGSGKRERMLLEFSRDEDVKELTDEFEAAKNRVREILLGNCRMLDNKMEKAGNYEITAPAGDAKYFECDNLKGTVQGGQEQVVKFTFIPPQTDPLLKNIGALRGIG